MFKSSLGAIFRNQWGEDVFRNKYRHEGCLTYEELCDTLVEDVCLDRMSDDDKDELKDMMKRGLIVAGGRYLYYAGRSRKFYNNCFGGDTKVLTDRGWACLADAVGSTVGVVSPVDGKVYPAEIHEHGKQQLNTITFASIRGHQVHTWQVRATRNHRWRLVDGSDTYDLRVDDVVPANTFSANYDAEGFAHGFIFGYGNSNGQLRLCSAKDKKYLSWLEPVAQTVTYPPSAGGDPVLYFGHSDHWKALPVNKSREYIASFIKGWLAADGSETAGNKLCSINKGAIEWFREHAAYAGITITGQLRSQIRDVTLGKYIYKDHEIFIQNYAYGREFSGYKVVSIEPGEIETVYCPFEPVHNRIVIDHNIDTFQCYLLRAEFDTREDWAELSKKAESCLMTGGGIGVDYCLAPGTKVLRADLTWQNIEELTVGEELIAFDEHIDLRKGCIQKAYVQSLGKARLPAYKITTTQGVIVASEEHQFVYRDNLSPKKKGQGYRWATTQQLRIGNQIAFTSKPWAVDRTFEGGWLSGMFDGEGWATVYKNHKLAVGVSQKNGPTLERLKRLLTMKDIRFNESTSVISDVAVLSPAGRWEMLKTIGMLRPERLLEKVLENGVFGAKARGKHTPAAIILSIEFLGDTEVVTIGTSTKTLIANGFLSHNSVYRSRGSILHGTGGTASGAVSKMEMVNEIGRHVIQGGSRRSAIYASLNWAHGDADEFLKAKNWFNKKLPGTDKTYADAKMADFNFPCPLDGTNISLNYDTKWLLGYWSTDKVGETFKQNVRQALSTGEPGFSFNFFNKENETLRNACTEVTSEDDSDVCNLASLNLSRIGSLQEMVDATRLATMFLVCGGLVSHLPYLKVEEVRAKNRRIGLGLMGIHEWLIQRGYKYEVTEELTRWLRIYKSVSNDTANKFSDALSVVRPICRRAIAPTGTIGILAGTTTGIEALFAVAYKRRFLKGNKWHYKFVIDGTAQTAIDHYGLDPDTLDTALSLSTDPERRIRFQADVQDFVDMSISSTINLAPWGSDTNNEDKVDAFANTLARYCHRLRGFTVYPDGSRGGQPLTPVSYKDAKARLNETFEEGIEVHDICDIQGRGGTCGA